MREKNSIIEIQNGFTR